MEWYLKVMKQYTNFSGRARRKEYWMYVLFYSLFLITAMIIDNVAGFCFETEFMGETISSGYGWLYMLTALIHFLPSLSVVVRRLHDVGKSGWWFLIALTIIGIILLIVWWASDTKPAGERYSEV